MFNNLTEGEKEQKRSWFKFKRWMIPIAIIGFWAIFTYSAKLGLISEKYFDLFCDFSPFLLFGAITWLIIELIIWALSTSIREGSQDYFTCQICHKQFYKDYQTKKGICKDCYKKI